MIVISKFFLWETCHLKFHKLWIKSSTACSLQSDFDLHFALSLICPRAGLAYVHSFSIPLTLSQTSPVFYMFAV